MRGTELLDKMELIDPVYVKAADASPKSKKNVWVKWGAIAVCLCLVFMGTMIWRLSTQTHNEDMGLIVSEDGVTIPKMNVLLSSKDNAAADMMGFFIYQGRCYVQYEWIYNDVNFIGERLGTATGFIDEWTPADGYVDFAGSVDGDFYAVEGISPEFMLCMRFDNDAVCTYVNDNGITLKTGTDLFEDRLHVFETYTGLTYQTHGAWQSSDDEYFILRESYIQEVLHFLEALDQASFLPREDVPYDYDQVLYHIDLMLENGMSVRIRLFPNGYVYFDGIRSVLLKMESEAFERFVALLDTGKAGIPAQKIDNSTAYDEP